MHGNLLAGKNALITGAGRNIGRGIAIEMAMQAANVYFTDIDAERLRRLELKLGDQDVKSKGFLSDVSNPDDIDSLVTALLDKGIRIDILINNVGLPSEATSTRDLSLQEWHRIFDANVFGPMYLTKLITERMIDAAAAGSIIFITSVHQHVVGRWPSYSASKAALGMITKELAVDLAPYGIRVNAVAPGHVSENLAGANNGSRYAYLHQTPIPPGYIGRAAVFLASDHFSRFTTGTVLTVDAGLSLYSARVAQSPPNEE